MEYIKGEPEKGCLFCNIYNEKRDRERLVVHRGDRVYVMLNKYPYIGGHLLVVPVRHVSQIKGLKSEENLELMKMTSDAVEALKRSMKPHGFNIGINIGRAAGAGIPGHLHIHIVPRWNGDNNFMAVLGDTRMINEHLERTYKSLLENWR